MVEGMNDFVFMAIVVTAAVLFVIGLGRVVFKRGLAIRIFLVVTPAMGIIGYCGFVIGALRFPMAVAVCVLIAVAIATFSMAILNTIVVKQYQRQINNLLESVAQLSATAQETSAAAAEQSSAVNQVTTTVAELDQMSITAAESAGKVLKSATDGAAKGKEGIVKISETVRVIEAVGKVREIVDTVNDLAEQSNLLAVNAGIEAAKAGDFGRGFAVVASEMRRLANQSKEATTIIRDAIDRTEEGRRSIASVQKVVYGLAAILETSSDGARQIAGVTTQQSAGIRQITDAMVNLAQGGGQIAVATDQVEEAVLNLTKISDDLRAFVTGVRVS